MRLNILPQHVIMRLKMPHCKIYNPMMALTTVRARQGIWTYGVPVANGLRRPKKDLSYIFLRCLTRSTFDGPQKICENIQNTSCARYVIEQTFTLKFCRVCGLQVWVWGSYRTFRSFGYWHESVTEFPEVPGIVAQAYRTHRSSGRV